MSTLALLGGQPIRTQPFARWPIYGKEEEEYLIQCLHENRWAVGKRTGIINQFEEKFAAYHQAKKSVACTNCTQALEILLAVHGIEPNDEVIVPAYTFIATASAVAKVGAHPIFADINPDTLLIDPRSVEALITDRTRAIIAVHFAGQFADMEALSRIARSHNLTLIEDSAQAHGAKWKGVYPGHYAPAAFSFQYSKNMTAGEGGIIISNNETLIEKCWKYIWHGRKKGGLWYEHFETTSNYRLTEWSAAVLLAQLERLESQNQKRMVNANYLTESLNQDHYLFPCLVDSRVEIHPRHLFPMRINRDIFGSIPKETLVKALAAEGLPIMPGYKFPLYKNPAFQNGKYGLPGSQKKDYTDICLHSTEEACKNTIWIIHHTLLGTIQDMNDIVSGIQKVALNVRELSNYTS